jgi:hypothetical protein
LRIISADFKAIYKLLIGYSAFVRHRRKMELQWDRPLEFYRIQESLSFGLEGSVTQYHNVIRYTHETSWAN